MRRSGHRVLVVGPAKEGDMAWFVARSYRRLGWQVAVLDDRSFMGRGLPGKLGVALQLLERDHSVTGRARRLGALLRWRAQSCDLAITVKGEYLLPEDVAAVAAQVPFVNWHPDHPFLDQHLTAVSHYTLFCPKDSWSTARLRAMGLSNVMTLPHASDPDLLGGPAHQGADPTVSVLGSIYPYRMRWINQVLDQGLEVAVWGGSVPGSPPATRSRRQQAVGREQGRAFRAGLFTLNTHHPHDVAGGNQRLFDAAAAGAPQLTEHLPESLRHFDPGSEICTFEDPEQFVTWVKELASDPELRMRLGSSSQERCRDEHTYEHRLQTILSLI